MDEALRLVEVSKASLYNEARGQGDQSPSSKIYNLIRAMKDSGAAAVGDGGELSIKKVRERVIAKGFTEDQFNQALDEYALLDVSLPYFRSRKWLLTKKSGMANRCRRHTTSLHRVW